MATHSPRPAAMAMRQQGMSLIVVLVLLGVATALGISGYRISVGGERSARSDRDYQVAWQSAEMALADAETDLEGPGTSLRQTVFGSGQLLDFVAGCGAAASANGKGLCLPAMSGQPVWLAVDLSSSSGPFTEFGDFTGRTFDAGGNGVRPAYKPRYLIEALPDAQLFSDKSITAPKKLVYRVTALGFGTRDSIQAVMQMIYRKE